MEKGVITERQFAILAAMTIIGDALLVMPGFFTIEAKQDAWLSALLSLLLGLLVIGLFVAAANCFPRLNLIESLQKAFGKWLGALLSLLYLYYVLMAAGGILREAGDFIITHSLPQTPMVAVLLLFGFIIAMAVRLGLEAFTRTSELLFGVFIIFYLFLCVALLPQINLKELQPVLSNGAMPVLRGSFIGVTFTFGEVSALLMITPYVKWSSKKSVRQRFYSGAIIGGVVLLIITVLAIVVLGPGLTAKQIYPTYTLVKKISIGNFLERLEAMLAIMWTITNYFRMVLYSYTISLGLSVLLRLDDYRLLAIPVSLLIVLSAMTLYSDIVYYITELTRTWPFFDLTFGIGIPLLLLLGGIVHKGVKLLSK